MDEKPQYNLIYLTDSWVQRTVGSILFYAFLAFLVWLSAGSVWWTFLFGTMAFLAIVGPDEALLGQLSPALHVEGGAAGVRPEIALRGNEMFDLQFITNEKTGEKRLYYRFLQGHMDASGALNVAQAQWSPWTRVPERSLEESALQDLIESGGIQNAP